MMVLRLALVVVVMAVTGARADSEVCSTVTCIANGESECDRSSESCPPCMYLLTTGSYSCYDLVDGACPYDEAYTTCDSSSSSSGSTAASSSSTAATSAPATTTAAPSTSTSTSSSSNSNSTATTATSASSSGSDGSSSGAGTVSPTTVKVSAPSSSASSASAGTSSSSGSSLRSASSTGSTSSTSAPATSSSSGSSSSSSSTISTGSSTNSSNVVMTAVLVGCTLVGAVILAVFIAHRVRRRRQLERDQYRSTFGHDGAMFVVPPSTKSPSMYFASRMYGSHATPGTSSGNRTLDSLDNSSFVMLADSRTQLTPTTTTNTTTSGVTMHSMASLSSSTADFVVGPQFRPEDSTIVDLSASTVSTASTKTHPPSPITPVETQVTRIPHGAVPRPIVEEEEEEMSSFEQQSRYVRLASAESVIYAKKNKFAPDSSGISISSSMSSLSDEYDIVDPDTIREGERRNTELLVRDSEFPKFSSFSESDLLSEDGDDEDRLELAKEHEI